MHINATYILAVCYKYKFKKKTLHVVFTFCPEKVNQTHNVVPQKCEIWTHPIQNLVQLILKYTVKYAQSFITNIV